MTLTLARPNRDLLTAEDFQEQIDAGEAQLWAEDGFAIMLKRVAYHRSGEVVCEAGPASGEMAALLDAVPRMEAWARSIGCTQVHVHAGRGGWERALRDQGYEVAQIILRKVLA